MNQLTEEQAFVVTCWSQTLFMNSFGRFHELAEAKLNRPIFTHEFAYKQVWKQLQQATEVEFRTMVGTDDIERRY